MATMLFGLKGKRIAHRDGFNGTLHALCIKDIAISDHYLHFIGERSTIIMEIPLAITLIEKQMVTNTEEIDHCVIDNKYTLSL